MINEEFYNELIRKYIVLFGTLFNEIYISRSNENQKVQQLKVPIAYGPREKFLARLEEDPDIERRVAIQLPRLSFEITGMSYDETRKTNSLNMITTDNTNNSVKRVWNPVTYDLNIQLSIMVKSMEDGTKIVEQILPFFQPTWTVSAKLLEDFPDMILDVPVTLNGVTPEDAYTGSFQERRVFSWILDFTMKVKFFGPVKPSRIIKIAKVDAYPHMDASANGYHERVTLTPGLTPDGQPTSYSNNDLIQATATAVLSGNSVVRIDPVNTGLGYSSANVVISNPATGRTAKAVPVISEDKIIAYDIRDGGTGYSIEPSVTVTAPNMGSVSYFEIEEDDNYGYITTIENVND